MDRGLRVFVLLALFVPLVIAPASIKQRCTHSQGSPSPPPARKLCASVLNLEKVAIKDEVDEDSDFALDRVVQCRGAHSMGGTQAQDTGVGMKQDETSWSGAWLPSPRTLHFCIYTKFAGF
jgi:hypothetical protein